MYIGGANLVLTIFKIKLPERIEVEYCKNAGIKTKNDKRADIIELMIKFFANVWLFSLLSATNSPAYKQTKITIAQPK